jgi:hypothetical protein
MTTGHLSVSVKAVATMREMKSVPPPGVKGTSSLMGLFGKSCALKLDGNMNAVATKKTLKSDRNFFTRQSLS